MKWGEDFQDSLRTDVHDEATQSSLAALDAEETNLEDTIRASIALAIRTASTRTPITDQWTKGRRTGMQEAEQIAWGESS